MSRNCSDKPFSHTKSLLERKNRVNFADVIRITSEQVRIKHLRKNKKKMERITMTIKKIVMMIVRAYKHSMNDYGEALLNGRGYTCA